MSLNDALLKTKRSLGSAERALARMHTAAGLVEVEDQWEAIIYALAQVVKTLAPLKTDPALAPLLKAMELDRRGGDPLVSYVYEARNAKDHGLKPITVQQKASTAIGSTSGNLKIEHLQIGGTTFKNIEIIGYSRAIVFEGPGADKTPVHVARMSDPTETGRVFIDRTPEHVQLIAVSSEKTKRTYPAPVYHQGSPISGSVESVSTLALTYYQDKFAAVLKALHLDGNPDYTI